jgi:hypothetical protein
VYDQADILERRADRMPVADVADVQLRVDRKVVGPAVRMDLRVEVVEDADRTACTEEVLDDERPDETCSARHEYAVAHLGTILTHHLLNDP